MFEERDVPTPPMQQQPTPTTVPGITVETGHLVGALKTRRAAIDAEDRRTFQRTVPGYDDLEALRHVCQQPTDVLPHKRHYDGETISDDPGWQGLRVEVVGFPLPLDGARVPLRHPWVYREYPGFDGPCIIARWLHRHPDKPGVLEVGWDGNRWMLTRVRRSVHFSGEGTAGDAARLLALWSTGTPKIRPHRSRSSHVEQAVRAARHFLHGDPPRTPTRLDIASFIAAEEGFVGEVDEFLNTLKSRWGRDRRRVGELTITMPEVLEIARQEMHP